VTTAAAPPLLDQRWWFELDWLCSETVDPTPGQTLLRLAQRLARADPANPAEMAFIIEQARRIVAAAG
jgi:hypothetical protein